MQNGKAYNKLYPRPMDFFLAIVWSIWNCTNNVIFRNYDVQSGHIISLAVSLFEYLGYYNVVAKTDSSTYVLAVCRKRSSEEFLWRPPTDGCLKLL